MKLSDEDIIKSLRRAGIPSRFHSKSINFGTVKTPDSDRMKKAIAGDEVSSLSVKLSQGHTHTMLGDDAETLDLFYLSVRALILRGCPIAILNMTYLANASREERREAWKVAQENRVLALVGMDPFNCNPFGDDASYFEWLLLGWLNDERGLFILYDVEKSVGYSKNKERPKGIWSSRLLDMIKKRDAKY